jgi:tripartite-type tricarboxylate transporter receptor subunit TctC
MRFIISALALAVAALAAGPVAAQDYPTETIRIVVPYTAGGGSDLAARIYASNLSDRLGQTVIVENRVGASGIIGAEYVAKAPADGYTLLFTPSTTWATHPFLFPSLPYDQDKDFTPVASLFKSVNVLAVHRDVPVENVQQLIDYAKKNPRKLNYLSVGTGTASHLGMELFNTMAGTKILQVPYKGTAEGIPELLAGKVQVVMDAAPTLLPHIQSGVLRALGSVGAPEDRNPALPDLIPVSATLKGFDASLTLYLSVRSGTPQPIVDRLAKEIGAASADPKVQEQLKAIGFTPYTATTDVLVKALAEQTEKWRAILKKACNPTCG